jgi:predicted  nucleic acid-binding Zn-ribbon protein
MSNAVKFLAEFQKRNESAEDEFIEFDDLFYMYTQQPHNARLAKELLDVLDIQVELSLIFTYQQNINNTYYEEAQFLYQELKCLSLVDEVHSIAIKQKFTFITIYKQYITTKSKLTELNHTNSSLKQTMSPLSNNIIALEQAITEEEGLLNLLTEEQQKLQTQLNQLRSELDVAEAKRLKLIDKIKPLEDDLKKQTDLDTTQETLYSSILLEVTELAETQDRLEREITLLNQTNKIISHSKVLQEYYDHYSQFFYKEDASPLPPMTEESFRQLPLSYRSTIKHAQYISYIEGGNASIIDLSVQYIQQEYAELQDLILGASYLKDCISVILVRIQMLRELQNTQLSTESIHLMEASLVLALDGHNKDYIHPRLRYLYINN